MARVCVDSTYFDVGSNGLLTFKPSSVGIQQMLVIQASTTFTKATYPGLRKVQIQAVGGGGGAAGAQAVGFPLIASPSASGGSYVESLVDASVIGASETVTVGAAGLGGLGNVAGTNGGQSSFGSLVIAPGGIGSASSMPQGSFDWTAPGANFGATGTGAIGTTGSAGGHAHRGVDGTAQVYPGGAAGRAYGAGGAGRVSDGQGNDASSFGSGGAGAISFGNNYRGGNGAPGVVVLILHY